MPSFSIWFVRIVELGAKAPDRNFVERVPERMIGYSPIQPASYKTPPTTIRLLPSNRYEELTVHCIFVWVASCQRANIFNNNKCKSKWKRILGTISFPFKQFKFIYLALQQHLFFFLFSIFCCLYKWCYLLLCYSVIYMRCSVTLIHPIYTCIHFGNV